MPKRRKADPEAEHTKPSRPDKKNGGDLGFEDKLWKAADELRGNMDAAEYKHVVLGLIFLKYISDAFEEKRQQLRQQPAEYHVDLEDRDEYLGFTDGFHSGAGQLNHWAWLDYLRGNITVRDAPLT